MVKSRVVTIEEIKKDNPILCLSPNRFLGNCHKCEVFIRNAKQNKNLCIEEAIKKMKCNPQIDMKLLKRISYVSERKKQLLAELKTLDEEV